MMGDEGLGVLEFLANSIQVRAAHYRERAAHLLDMAEGEPVERLRERLTELARQFEELADSIAIIRR